MVLDSWYSVTFPILLASSFSFSQTIIRFDIDFTKDVHPISPYIYGINNGAVTAADGATFARSGGNRLTGYNWENNASNAGTDYGPNSSDSYLGNTTQPGKAITDFVEQNNREGLKSLVTLQAAGYVAKDKNGNVVESETSPSRRWSKVIFEKSSAFTSTPDANDSAVYMNELVNFLKQKYGPASSTTGVFAYNMDNEPALWPLTHPRLHPAKSGAAEVANKNVALASAVKKIDPTALIYGGVFYGFAEYNNMQEASDWPSLNAGNKYVWYVDYFLETLRKASESAGKRLLDVLDVHWYPEAMGDTRINGNNVSLNDVKARMQAPRSLWDNTYIEKSWIAQAALGNRPINLLPRLFASISKNYPDTKLSISEFNYGAPMHVSGGIATADFLGIVGRMQVYSTNVWPESTGPYFAAAYRLFRNYDGKKSAFGANSVRALSSNQDSASVYASFDANTNKVHVIVLNKSVKTSVQGTFAITSPVSLTQSKVFGFDSTTSTLSEKMAVASISGNQFIYTIPALSAYHFEIQTSGVLGVVKNTRNQKSTKRFNTSSVLFQVPGSNGKTIRSDGRKARFAPTPPKP